MKKVFLCAMCAAVLASCNNGAGKKEQALTEERDSLMQVISDKDSELNEIMGTVNEIQEGFRRINEAEGRITVNNGDVESEASKQSIRENMQFIQDAMAHNREMISQLKEKLRTSSINADKLKKMVDDLSAQLDAQNLKVQELEAQLAEKDIVIARQGEAITTLNENVNTLTAENQAKSQTVADQDKQIHTAWYVFGTKSELKEQKILQKGDVLKSDDFNQDYFTKVDIPFVANAAGVKNFSHPSDILSTGFGQSSSVTALQMVQAYSAIFNDGVMMRPYVVEKIVDSYSNETIKSWSSEEVGQPISAQSAEYVRELMGRVVSEEYGSGSRYAMEDVDVVAKTGTGQIAGENGYDDEVYTSSVMMAAPADDPKVMVYYCFVSENIIDFDEEPIKNVFKEALIAANVTSSQSSTQEENSTQDTEEGNEQWSSYEMPVLVNHSLDYVSRRLEDMDVECVIIGDGDEIVAQYPQAQETITSNERIILLSDASTLTMPDMKGWTRKDVTAFWKLTGIPISISGSGKVVSQSIEAGQAVSTDSEISVKLE